MALEAPSPVPPLPDRTESTLPVGEQKRIQVREMFDRIAPRYDLLNRLMTLGLDQRWRRKLLDLAGVEPGDVVVDLACGTGDLAELAAARGAQVIGVDFAGQMLREARQRGVRAKWVQADGEGLPLPTGSASVVTCGFALRNFVHLDAVFHELHRVTAPGGCIALIDVDRPTSSLVRFGHSLYFDRVVPLIGALLSDRRAYRYLPQSTAYLPPGSELAQMLRRVGFTGVTRIPLLLGTAQILLATRSRAS